MKHIHSCSYDSTLVEATKSQRIQKREIILENKNKTNHGTHYRIKNLKTNTYLRTIPVMVGCAEAFFDSDECLIR